MAAREINITGQKFNMLTAIKRNGSGKPSGLKSRSRRTLWLFQCDCGNQITTCKANVKKGLNKSCGCHRKKILSKFQFTKQDVEVVGIKHLYYKYLIGAKDRNLVFEINGDQFADLIKGNCFYCGAEPKAIKNIGNPEQIIKKNGIDRLDNNKGYTVKNCVSSCKKCNGDKHSVTLNIIKKVYEHLGLENYAQ